MPLHSVALIDRPILTAHYQKTVDFLKKKRKKGMQTCLGGLPAKGDCLLWGEQWDRKSSVVLCESSLIVGFSTGQAGLAGAVGEGGCPPSPRPESTPPISS